VHIGIGMPGRCQVFFEIVLVFKILCYHNLILNTNHLIGSAYSLSKFLMVPYKDNGHLTNR